MIAEILEVNEIDEVSEEIGWGMHESIVRGRKQQLSSDMVFMHFMQPCI